MQPGTSSFIPGIVRWVAGAILLTSCSGAPVVSPTPDASEPLSASPHETPEPATPSPPSSPEPLRPETLAVVVVDDVNVRNAPGMAAPVQTVAPGAAGESGNPIRVSAGDLVWVLAEEPVGGTIWYHIVLDNRYLTGWISGGPQTDPWLNPFDTESCPSSLTAALSERPIIRPFSMENLACFGGERLHAVVYWPTPEEGQSDVPCPWPDVGAQWLICHEGVNVTGVGSPQLTVYGTQGRDDIRRGAWVRIVGHYDDPRARDCPEDLGRDMTETSEVAATILSCRSAFVLDEVRPSVAP